MKNICVFCGSASGREGGGYMEQAQSFGRLLAKNKMSVVYGGASIGVMAAVANSALEEGAEVYGVIPEFLKQIEIGHLGLTKLHIVETMHERKQIMYDLSDAFVALPGGFGTLDELCEIMTWAQLKHHEKPCFILNENGFFDALLKHFDSLVTEGFLSAEHRKILTTYSTQEELIEHLCGK